MDCTKIEAMLSDFVEGTLSPSQNQNVLDHLKECGHCRRLKEKIEDIVFLAGELQEDIPFFLKNRLYNIPETDQELFPKLQWLKWVAAAVGTLVLFLNLFYFTNIYPPANRALHILVAKVEGFAVETGAFLGRITGSKDRYFLGLFQNDEEKESTTEELSEIEGGNNG